MLCGNSERSERRWLGDACQPMLENSFVCIEVPQANLRSDARAGQAAVVARCFRVRRDVGALSGVIAECYQVSMLRNYLPESGRRLESLSWPCILRSSVFPVTSLRCQACDLAVAEEAPEALR